MNREAKKFYRKSPYIIFLIVAVTFFFVGIFDLTASDGMKDYQKTTGVVSNLKTTTSFRKGKHISRYSYDVTWKFNGKEHTKHFSKVIDYMPEGETNIWVAKDQDRCMFESPEDGKKTGIQMLLVGIVSGIAATVLYVYRKKVSELMGSSKDE